MGRVSFLRALTVFAEICGLSTFVGCGESILTQDYNQASEIQSDINGMTLQLWQRSPIVDSNGAVQNSTGNLDTVPRSPMAFPNLISDTGPVASAQITVYKSPTDLSAPSFYSAAGQFVSSSNTDFQALLTYSASMKVALHSMSVFPDADFTSPTNKIFPMTVYALEPGDVTGTHYDPSDKTIHLFTDSTSPVPNYHVSDETDAVFHEFGHGLQDALNQPVIDTPVPGFADLYPANRDLNGILEALADFNAASIAVDGNILSYLSANLPLAIAGLPLRTGNQEYIRTLVQTLAFPLAYVRESHLDGRVISGALNDFRLTLTNATSTSDGFDKALTLGYRAYQAMATTVTYFEYASLLVDRCQNDADISVWCNNPATLASLQTVLSNRGLLPSGVTANNAALHLGEAAAGVLNAATPASSPAEVDFDSNLGFMEFPNDANFSNDDGNVDPCEVLLVFPAIANLSATDSVYDITVRVSNISGFSDFNDPSTGTPVEEVVNYAQAPYKGMGWLSPGQTSPEMINFLANGPSSWYQPQLGAYLTQPLSDTYYPSDVGWLVRAPATLGAVGSIQFVVTMRRYNASALTATTTAIVTQSLSVSTSSTTSFCSGD